MDNPNTTYPDTRIQDELEEDEFWESYFAANVPDDQDRFPLPLCREDFPTDVDALSM